VDVGGTRYVHSMETRHERGARIRRRRLREKLSIYQLAVRAGAHPNSVRLAEHGACSDAMLDRVETALARTEPKP
jgi:transcriptional regulator with XRE-family HTH domain